MKTKRFALLAILVLALIFIAACRQNETSTPEEAPTPTAAPEDTQTPEDNQDEEIEEQQPEDREIITVSVMNWGVANSFSDDGEICELYQYVIDHFGIMFEPIDVGWDNHVELAHLWAAANTLPDIIGAADFVATPTLSSWAEAGIIRPLPDNMERFPYLYHMVRQPSVTAFDIDGQTFFIPRGNDPYPEYTAMARGIINRRDWRESLGIPIPQTPEDFMDMWRAFMENDMMGDGSIVFGVLPDSTGILNDQAFATFGDTRHAWVQMPNGDMVIPGFERSALPLMSFWRDAFQEGLVDPDFITNPSGVSQELFALGRAGTLIRQIAPLHLRLVYDRFVELTDIDFFEAVEILMPPTVPGITPQFLRGTGFWSETYFSSRLDDYTMDRVMEYFNWAASPTGIATLQFGFEGRDWQWSAEGMIEQLTDINPDTNMPFRANAMYTFAAGGMGNLVMWGGAIEYVDPSIDPRLINMAREFLDNLLENYEFTPVDNRLRAINLDEVNEMPLRVSEEFVAFMTNSTATSHEELWEQFHSRWVANGLQRAYDAMTAEVAARGY
ncbi:MAG: hypothetical protein FWC73_12390 [Defluviitaleaceae bacterium]|nr:hypothetical protein [Defluviitaleaceae bacterium]